ncbi:MAG: Oligosaccharyl transferase STT3 subunit [Candidatus Micrarchaeum acidiphilum ARMAN-2]|uniref:dolichyl-phosphooligosaccharide-protein glycotransferase n=1 Tax=Candidatus Micrarchaeum acidiphilum ARMAN-2 TaxID=425595 RepID=C7DHF1_MICA2|nr:MAG: Oligosaccharyl transferase STT3 subunit [Candidatus Micrarchaeum acidiphilum ARMAN-2]
MEQAPETSIADAPPQRQQPPVKKGGVSAMLTKRNIAVLAAMVVIVVLGIYFRNGMLRFTGFFEPDGFFHYAVMRAAAAHAFAIPQYLSISGFPFHNAVTQALGDYYVTIYPYMLLHPFGVSYYTIMRLIAPFFGVLDIIGVFFLMRYFSKSNFLGLLGAFFIAISAGNIARTAALVYRGDGFISIFMLITIAFVLMSYRAEDAKRKWLYALAANLVLGFSMMIWSGAPYETMVYIFSIMMVTAYGFVTANRTMLKSSVVLTVALILEFAIQHIWMALGVLRNAEALSSPNFLIFYLPTLIGAVAAWYLVENRGKFSSLTLNATTRARVLFGVVVVAVILAVVLFGSYLGSIASGGGLIAASSGLQKSIKELAPPTFKFIWGSFTFQIFLAPLGAAMYLLFANRLGNLDYIKHRRFDININPVFLVFLSYLIVTGYLQANAIRYNSLFSLPVAVFSAYAVYSVSMLLYNRLKEEGYDKRVTSRRSIAFYAASGIIIAMVLTNLYYTYLTNLSSVPADDINPQFLQAMTWMKDNTPANATVLALWPDGSVVEGWANRTSAMDSVAGQNGTLIAGFARFLLNSSPDTQYLYAAHRPEYLVARGYWFSELSGIATEAGFLNATAVANLYGYNTFTGVHVTNPTNYTRAFELSSSQPPYYKGIVLTNSTNASDVVGAISSGNSNRFVPVAHVLFYNEQTDAYEIFNYTKPHAANFTIALYYTNSSITGAALFGAVLPFSNFFKLTTLCSYSSCSYGQGTNVSMKMIYMNSDTRIYRIYYNQTAP